MKKIILTFFTALFYVAFFADVSVRADEIQPTCAQQTFADALISYSNTVTEQSTETEIQTWIYKNFQDPAVIKKILVCPEVAVLEDEDPLKVPPVGYQFADGRKIIVNYETSPKILQQRIDLAGKRAPPCSGDDCISPNVGAPGDKNIWTNTDPAWYGILVVQAGSLDKFVGKDKNNTISLEYFEDNFADIYPAHHDTTKIWQIGGAITTPLCTSVSALADNNDIVNLAAKKSVNVEDDTNEYYVAGLADLGWITWAQVAFDVAVTVATVGGGTLVLGAVKGARAARAGKNLVETIRTARNVDGVRDWINATRNASRAAEELKNINRTTDATGWAAKSDDIKRFQEIAKGLENTNDVKKYKDAVATFGKLQDLRRGMKAWKIPQRGNVIARGFRNAKNVWKSARAITGGNAVIDNAAKIGRAGLKSGKIRDWLFQSTLKNAGRLAKMERSAGALYGAMKFAGDVYDWTEAATGEFTSNIEFKPLGLLSADDLTGQENVVNHGMWLMWAGDSVSPMDDDAAFLQAMDFANKFHQDMDEIQDEFSDSRASDTMCDVDIYVVRPIVRNPDSDDAQLFYLIMNDVPWKIRQVEQIGYK
jgi:hypothetical protein